MPKKFLAIDPCTQVIESQLNKKTYSSLPLSFFPDLRFDIFSDGQFYCTLADLCKIGAGKSFRHSGKVVEVHLRGDGGLSKVGPEDGVTAGLIWKWDVNQLIQTSWTKNGGIDDVRSVGKKCQS